MAWLAVAAESFAATNIAAERMRKEDRHSTRFRVVGTRGAGAITYLGMPGSFTLWKISNLFYWRFATWL